MTESAPRTGLYVHWPFCQSKCPYCDFNSHVVAKIDQQRWAATYEAEIARLGEELPDRVLSTIFFGGGTPSLMDPAVVDRVIRAARAAWPVANDLEVTLEANPGSAERVRFAGYRAAGVSRLSVGVQSLVNSDLTALGRLHSVDDAKATVRLAQSEFERVSFDLIYARQGQTIDDWRAELEVALELEPTHLSLYQLTIEDGTAFAARYAAGGLQGLPDEDRAVRLLELTEELTQQAGLPAYEVSNHSQPDQECRHNLIYWMGDDYIGIGPGAHGRLTIDGTRFSTVSARAPKQWLELVENRGSGELPREALSQEEVLQERLMMGLRLRKGIEIKPDHLEQMQILSHNIKQLVGDGFLSYEDGNLSATASGRPLLNSVLGKLLAG